MSEPFVLSRDELEVLHDMVDAIEGLDRLAPVAAVALGRPISSAPSMGPRTRALCSRVRSAWAGIADTETPRS